MACTATWGSSEHLDTQLTVASIGVEITGREMREGG